MEQLMLLIQGLSGLGWFLAIACVVFTLIFFGLFIWIFKFIMSSFKEIGHPRR